MYRGGVVLRSAVVPWYERIQPDHTDRGDGRVRRLSPSIFLFLFIDMGQDAADVHARHGQADTPVLRFIRRPLWAKKVQVEDARAVLTGAQYE